jgi:hypothetical protein
MQTPSPSPASADSWTVLAKARALLDSLHATILEERLQSPPVPPGAVVLLASIYTRHHHLTTAGHRVVVSDDKRGNENYLQCPHQADPERASHRPWLWYGSEIRVDAQGQIWSRSLPHHVINDFGDLVPVSA